MTDQEWEECGDSQLLLEYVPIICHRKLRLFACACCRAILRLLNDSQATAALEIGERFAEGEVEDKERSEGRKSAQQAAQPRGIVAQPDKPKVSRRAASSVYAALARDPRDGAIKAPLMVLEAVIWSRGGYSAPGIEDLGREIKRGQAALFRDIFENPYITSTIDPAWLDWGDAIVRSVAEATYRDRHLPSGHLDPVLLAVLSDALEDAGCTDVAILDHLRSPGPHVRGCWALDLILGKQ